MDRRDVLKYTALLTGATVGAPLMSVILSGCNADSAIEEEAGKLAFFSQEEFQLLTKLSDLILPKTDSPSASAAGVPRMIDQMVGTAYRPEENADFRKRFDTLAKYLAGASEEGDFGGMEDKAQFQLLLNLNNSEGEEAEEARKAFLDLKQQVVAYYLSTKEIATKYLNFLPVPGAYEACISLEEAGGKAWAL